jgi:hypothetical protein
MFRSNPNGALNRDFILWVNSIRNLGYVCVAGVELFAKQTVCHWTIPTAQDT